MKKYIARQMAAFVCVCLGFILTACSHVDSKQKDSDYLTISVKPSTSVDTKLSDIASGIEYIRLETNPDCMMGSISRLMMFNDRFYIRDDSQYTTIFCFDKKGKFISRFERSGKGPGEYIGINCFYIDEDKEQMVIYDRRQGKILRYSINGDFVNEITGVLETNQLAAYISDSYWFYTMGSEAYVGITPVHNLLHVDKDGKTIL